VASGSEGVLLKLPRPEGAEKNICFILCTALARLFGDRQSAICKHYGTLDVTVFNCTAREAHVSRGPAVRGGGGRSGSRSRTRGRPPRRSRPRGG